MPGRMFRPYGHNQIFLWPRQFLSRGHRTVHGEWTLFCTTHNLLTPWTTTRRRTPSRLRKNYCGTVEIQWSA